MVVPWRVRKTGGEWESGANTGYADGGQDKRTGTHVPAKPVCTWVGHGTMPGACGAVPGLDPASNV